MTKDISWIIRFVSSTLESEINERIITAKLPPKEGDLASSIARVIHIHGNRIRPEGFRVTDIIAPRKVNIHSYFSLRTTYTRRVKVESEDYDYFCTGTLSYHGKVHENSTFASVNV